VVVVGDGGGGGSRSRDFVPGRKLSELVLRTSTNNLSSATCHWISSNCCIYMYYFTNFHLLSYSSILLEIVPENNLSGKYREK
jgi:hypothetical protein